MKIDRPRRLLFISNSGCDVTSLIKSLTGSEPARSDDGSVAGSIHEWQLKTAYYTANIPVWIDIIEDLQQWKADFSQLEAREVIQALGGIIYCFDRRKATGGSATLADSPIYDTMRTIGEVVDTADGDAWDGFKLAVALPPDDDDGSRDALDYDAWEDLCLGPGYEFIDATATGRNDFGELPGIERIKEVVEANEWQMAPSAGSEDDAEVEGFDLEQEEMNAELWGLKTSLLQQDEDGAEDEEAQVQDLENLMRQAMAIKESGAQLPLAQRKKHAREAISRLMEE